ncbi:leucyl-tRNA synthetase [Entomoplasma ellychniae]|uniref:Leucine--tRNA ligase n=1 Tax=Entomoplasma ellychniae TaxID=2114 RepID=A0A8E2QVF5_9MOLU|nr:leucine--tRNA ligase [Entomoplasma ellychniae]PPE04402.1 leucyl-tRNA synthetase [Entomoplasma ellychniae]
MEFSHKAIEKKWAKYWEENKTFKTRNTSNKKSYILDMFPYPSGAGIHVGHIKGYTSTDVISRMKLMQGYDVLHPMGWDAFGLPAEQYALKTGNDPIDFTLANIANFKNQLKMIGFTYDYDKEISTSNPNFYKVTQWIFVQMYKKGLAEYKNVEVNWCQELGTVLANDEIVEKDGVMLSERGDYPVVKKNMKQWVLKITKYAESLLQGLEEVEWNSSIKDLQRNWIGKSTGVEVIFKSNNININVFTTRVDTIYGVSYIVMAPEHQDVLKLTTKDKLEEVNAYIKTTKNKSEIDRKDESKPKTGVFTGSYAINPITNESVPIWISDYVLNNYGTGAVMSVPAHDNRDWEFATKFNLPIKFVLKTDDQSKAFIGESIHINSELINGLNRIEAIEKMTKYVEEHKIGFVKTNYKLRDWLFSRQRFYGEPFPILHGEDGSIVLVEDLPVVLPRIKDFKPSGDGQSPLAKVDEWVNVEINGVKYKRETNTMPNSAGPSWYFLAYILAIAENEFIDIDSQQAKQLFEKWLPIDVYVGGQEHAVGHLLYARFWMHVLYDLKIVNTKEPFKKLYNQGMILGPDNRKMSKRWGNVINPDDVVQTHGADSLRLYEMFMGPFEASLPWSEEGLDSALKWVHRAFRMVNNATLTNNNDQSLDFIYNDVVKKVTDMIESLKFNTAISQLMVFVNAIYKQEGKPIYKLYIEGFVQMLSTFAPFIGEELWERLGFKETILKSTWPTVDESKLVLSNTIVAIQVNGKLRATIEVAKNTSKEELLILAKSNDNVKSFISNKQIIKEIVVVDKIVNIVVK